MEEAISGGWQMAKLAKQVHYCQFFAKNTELGGVWLGWKRCGFGNGAAAANFANY